MHNIDGPPIKNCSNWRSKINCPELETFLTTVEKNLFQNTKIDNKKDNLTRTERKALANWRKDNLFNKESDTIMRLQDKGNKFDIVDKDTSCLKAQKQIACSSFTKLDHDLTYTHIQKVQE